MVCDKCGTKGILNTVLGKDFYYCRGCKDEISLKPQGLTSGEAIQALSEEPHGNYIYRNNPFLVAIKKKHCPLSSNGFITHKWDFKSDHCDVCGITGLQLGPYDAVI